jgi:hypothetical protein
MSSRRLPRADVPSWNVQITGQTCGSRRVAIQVSNVSSWPGFHQPQTLKSRLNSCWSYHLLYQELLALLKQPSITYQSRRPCPTPRTQVHSSTNASHPTRLQPSNRSAHLMPRATTFSAPHYRSSFVHIMACLPWSVSRNCPINVSSSPGTSCLPQISLQ